jgi:hypothetical protein
MKEELMGMGLLSLGVTFCSEAIDVRFLPILVFLSTFRLF